MRRNPDRYMTTPAAATAAAATQVGNGIPPTHSEPINPNLPVDAKPNETRMLRLTEVIRRTGLGKTKLYELQKAGLFPMRVHVTETAVRWVDHEVEAWLRSQARLRPADSANRQALD